MRLLKMEQLQKINEKNEYCHLLINPLLSCLIMDTEEIILLKYLNKLLINKYRNHPMQRNILILKKKMNIIIMNYYLIINFI